MCVSDSECKPVFFNTNGKIIESCKGKSLKLSVDTLVMNYFYRLALKVLFFETWYRHCISKNCVARSVFPDVFICSIIPNFHVDLYFHVIYFCLGARVGQFFDIKWRIGLIFFLRQKLHSRQLLGCRSEIPLQGLSLEEIDWRTRQNKLYIFYYCRRCSCAICSSRTSLSFQPLWKICLFHEWSGALCSVL